MVMEGHHTKTISNQINDNRVFLHQVNVAALGVSTTTHHRRLVIYVKAGLSIIQGIFSWQHTKVIFVML